HYTLSTGVTSRGTPGNFHTANYAQNAEKLREMSRYYVSEVSPSLSGGAFCSFLEMFYVDYLDKV
ncbi:hypothetical protein, partial [Candidatus Hakubella thermalkaliphila]|uniref:hypothetical protein n=1 Tax=Candidatus Hakubella thermalkaliphila TaxID=2754717 RepID=UPI001C614D96